MSYPYGENRPNPAAGTPVEAPEPANAGFNASDIERIVSERLAAVESRYDAKIRQIEKLHADEMRAARGTLSVDHKVPEHAGGSGTEIHQVWSQYHQELSRNGQLTETHVRNTQGLVPVETGDDV